MSLKSKSDRVGRLRQTSSHVLDRVERAAVSSLPPLPAIASAHSRAPRPPAPGHHPSESFPSLIVSSGTKGTTRTTPWTGISMRPGTASTGSMIPKNMFPSLPSSSRSQAPKEFVPENQSTHHILSDPPAKSAWNWKSREAAALHPAFTVEESSSNKRRNKKGKERLFTLGSLPTA